LEEVQFLVRLWGRYEKKAGVLGGKMGQKLCSPGVG